MEFMNLFFFTDAPLNFKNIFHCVRCYISVNDFLSFPSLNLAALVLNHEFMSIHLN